MNTVKSLCYFPSFISSFLLLVFFPSYSRAQQVDLIIHHAVIYTADSNFTVKEALAITKGKIVATGSNEEILKRFKGIKAMDAGGKFIYPGFIDAHCHFTGYATDMWKCDLTGTASFHEIVAALTRYASTTTTIWLYGRGWDQNDWEVKEFPGKEKLDALFPNRPVFLKRIDGHAALANQKALDIAGVTPATKVEGGSIEVQDGALTGILIDNAMDLVERCIPPATDEMARKYFLQAQDSCFQYGLTGVHDCGVSDHTISLLRQVQSKGLLQIKIYALLSDREENYEKWIKKGPFKTTLLHVGGFKLYADGALGSRGACLLQPYADKPGWHGLILSSKDHFEKIARELANTGFQLCTHAIGDSGNRMVLNIYKEVLKGKNDKRWRIEHAQVVDKADIGSFGNYAIIPSVQPTHATSDMYWAVDRLGEARIKTAYAYKELLDQNGWMPLGTDFPVEAINPFKTFYAAVARKDSKGFPAGGFQPTNALSPKEALLGMTLWAAKAAFEDAEKGSLEPGKAADMVIADTDIINGSIDAALHAKVLATFVNGKKVYPR